MFLRGTLLTMFLASQLLAAPVPPYRRKPPPLPTPGEWVLTWAGIRARVTLGPDGTYFCLWGTQTWRGTWYWHPDTRTFYIHETSDGQTWSNWSVQLDEGLAGVAVFGSQRTAVSILPFKEGKSVSTTIAAAR